MRRQTFFATCAPGVEPWLHAEVRGLKLGLPERQVGGVRFVGSLRDAWRANLWLRTAVRVLWRLDRFDAGDEEALYAGVAAVDWSRWLATEGSLWVDAQTRESSLDHSRYVAQRVKDAVVDQLRTPAGARPRVEREDPDLRLHLHLFRDRATLSVDTSGEPLHKRGWRRAQGRAPLAENLAAAVVLASGWDRRSPLIDPFCGSGTLLVEAGLLATGTPPGAFRGRFAFERLPGHERDAWARLRADALARARPTRAVLVGGDVEEECVEAARANLEAAGLTAQARLAVEDARDFAPRRGWNGWVVTNVPYGERVGSEQGARELVRAFGGRLRAECAGYHAGVLVGEDQVRALDLPEARSTRLVNGGIECALVTAAL